jgi:hypothetical protein
MDGQHPHSVCSANGTGTFRCDGYYTTPDELLDAAAKLTAQHRDVWFGVHGLTARPDTGRGSDDDVAEVRALHADIDWAHGDAHADPDLLDESETRARLARLEHQPSYMVDTGHGLHLYWLLAVPVPPERGAELIARMHAALRAVGLEPERDDLASVLRVPGTVNYKTDPVDVRIAEAHTERCYQPEYLEPRLPKLGGHTGTRRKGGWRALTNGEREALDPADREALGLLELLDGVNPRLYKGVLSIDGPASTNGSSVTIGHSAPGAAHVFTTSWPPLEANRTYNLVERRRLVNGGDDDEDGEDEDEDIAADWDFVDLGPALRGEIVRAQPTVLERTDGRGLLYPGQVNGIHGDSGAGKGWVALAAVIAELEAGHHVAWVDAEDPNETSIVERLLALFVLPDVISRLFHYVNPKTAARPLAIKRLLTGIDQWNVTLVVLDSVGELFGLEGLDENKDFDVGPWMRRVARPIALAGPAVLLVDHSTKAADNPLYPSGSKRKRAAITGAAYLAQDIKALGRGLAGVIRLTCAKDRHGNYHKGQAAASVTVESDGDTVTLKVWTPSHAEADAPQLPVILAARDAVKAARTEDRPLSLRQLVNFMQIKAGRDTKIAGIEVAVARGALTVEDGARGSRLHTYVGELPDNPDA